MSELFESCFYESSDGLRLHYRDFPARASAELAPAICLPGLTRNCRDFEHVSVWLSASRQVICPDLRGRGESAHDEQWHNYNPQQYVADVWQLLDRLNIESVLVIGTSLGGLLAMLMAHDRPAAVIAAIINDVGPEIDPAGLARVQQGAGRLSPAADWNEATELVREHYKISFPDWPDAKWRDFVHTTYRETDNGTIDLTLDRNVGEASRAGVSGLQENPWLLFDAFKGKPLLVLRGEHSDILSQEILARMQARNPTMETAIIPNRGHAPFLDEPEAIDAIDAFLRNTAC